MRDHVTRLKIEKTLKPKNTVSPTSVDLPDGVKRFVQEMRSYLFAQKTQKKDGNGFTPLLPDNRNNLKCEDVITLCKRREGHPVCVKGVDVQVVNDGKELKVRTTEGRTMTLRAKKSECKCAVSRDSRRRR